MKVDEHDRLVFFAGRKAAVDPIFRRSMARRRNKLQILAVGDFAGINAAAARKYIGKKNAQQ